MVDEKHEIEVKIRIGEDDLGPIRERAVEMGFRQTSPPKEEQNLLFDFPDRRLKSSGRALRLRRYGDSCRLTYKGPRIEDPRLKIRLEEETSVGDLETARRILEQLGLELAFRYDKNREKYRLEDEQTTAELCIDRTPVGCFVELEAARETISDLAASFGWSEEEFLNVNYVDLYAEQGLGR